MYIVTLEDGTIYNVDTDSHFEAESVVKYKLKNKLDCRRIKDLQNIKGVACDKNSKYYNSNNPYDGKDLQCTSGWNYRYN